MSYVNVLHIKRLLCRRRCLFSVLELDVRYEWRVTPPNTHRSLFLISHFYAYSVPRCIIRKLQVVRECSTYRTTAYIIEDFLCVVSSCNRDSTGQLQPKTRIGRSLMRHCMRILHACIHITIWYNYV